MSSAIEDWKSFEQFSDEMVVTDLTEKGHEIVLRNVRPGRWVSFCEYDDDFKSIERVLIGVEDVIAQAMDRSWGSPKKSKTGVVDGIELNEGVLCMFDKAFFGKWPCNYRLERPNSRLIDMWGDPEDEAKDEKKRFFELGWHLSIDPDINVPRIESGKFGVFGGMFGKKKLKIVVLRDSETFEVEGVEVVPDA